MRKFSSKPFLEKLKTSISLPCPNMTGVEKKNVWKRHWCRCYPQKILHASFPHKAVEWLATWISFYYPSKVGWRMQCRGVCFKLFLGFKYTAGFSYHGIYRSSLCFFLEISVSGWRYARLRPMVFLKSGKYQRLLWQSLWNLWYCPWARVSKKNGQVKLKVTSQEWYGCQVKSHGGELKSDLFA